MSETQAGRGRILVVDDSPANRLAFGTVLENAGYDVLLARSGPEAIDHAERERFALVLVDVRMPFMDGFEVTACLRRRERTQDVPIILVSAFDRTPAQITRGYQAGASDYLFHPIDEDILRSKVAAFTGVHRRGARFREEMSRLTAAGVSIESELSRLHPQSGDLRAKVVGLNQIIAALMEELGEEIHQAAGASPNPGGTPQGSATAAR